MNRFGTLSIDHLRKGLRPNEKTAGASEAVMKNNKFYGFLLISALIAIPNAVSADTGSTGASYKTSSDSYANSLDTPYRQSIGTNRLVQNKSTNQPQLSTTASTSSQNYGAFNRPGAFQYRKGYQRTTPCSHKVKPNRPGLPGHPPSASVPELDASISLNALALLFGGILVLHGRRRRDL
jgi:hypothetical protein